MHPIRSLAATAPPTDMLADEGTSQQIPFVRWVLVRQVTVNRSESFSDSVITLECIVVAPMMKVEDEAEA